MATKTGKSRRNKETKDQKRKQKQKISAKRAE